MNEKPQISQNKTEWGKKDFEDSPLFEIRLLDYKSKLTYRKYFVVMMSTLLIIQYAALFGFVYYLAKTDRIGQLQNAVAAVTGATLLETYGVIKIIVESVFKEIDYRT